MIFNIIMAAAEGEQTFIQKWGMIIVLGVLMIGMLVLSIVPQKKRQKKAQEMMNSISVGTTIKTIGGFVGVIKQINNNDNTFILDISADTDGSNLVKIDKSAVYTVMTPSNQVASANTQDASNNTVDLDSLAPADDYEAEQKAQAKKAKKNKTNDADTLSANEDDRKIDSNEDLKF